MRSLFSRIFLWFWLANLVMCGLVLLLTVARCTRFWEAMFAPAPTEMLHHSAPFALPVDLEPLARGAIAILESDGEEAFRAHDELIERIHGVRLNWLDEQGDPLFDQEVSRELQAFALGALERPGPLVSVSAAGERSALSVHVGERTYLVVSTWSHRPPTMSPAAGLAVTSSDAGPAGRTAPGHAAPVSPPLTDEHVAGANAVEQTESSTMVFPESETLHQSWLSMLSMALNVIQPFDIAAILAMTGLICVGLARYLTGPLRRVGVATRKIEQGELEARVAARITHRRDDIGELGRDLNAMAERVQGLIASQHRLLVDISHEIRSPLARLTVALGLVRRTQTRAQEPALERIEQEADQIDELISQLITLNRLETQPSAIRREYIRLDVLLQRIVDDVTFEARSKNRTLGLRGVVRAEVSGQSGLLRRAMENVIRNALKYTPEHSSVDIDMAMVSKGKSPYARIIVRDRGPGVPEGALAQIFEPFFRLGSARDRETGGTGLGLSIAARAVEFHDGRIEARNAPDGGLVLELQLPTTCSKAGSAADGPARSPRSSG